MGCVPCGQKSAKKIYKVVKADGSSKNFDSYPAAKQEVNTNGGRIRVTEEGK